MTRPTMPAPTSPPGGIQWKANGTAKAMKKMTTRAGSPRKNSM